MKTVQQIFIPGSKWVYFNLYTGPKTSDAILRQDIPLILNHLYKSKWIEKWFFIRYGNPDYHIRVRVWVVDENYIGDVIAAFYKHLNNLVEEGLIWKIQLDTYNRELERYGKDMIEEAETIFCLDSTCVVSLLKKLKGKDENYRWMIALILIDRFLSDFSMDITYKQQLMEKMALSFKTEFGFDMHNAKQFNTKYREHKETIEKVLKNEIADKEFNRLLAPIHKRTKELQPLIIQIQAKIKKQKTNGIRLDSLLSSYIHMTLNRLFRIKNRHHEMIIYDFLSRYYKSEIAKCKYAHT